MSDVARLLIEAGLEKWDAGKVEVELHPTNYRIYLD